MLFIAAIGCSPISCKLLFGPEKTRLDLDGLVVRTEVDPLTQLDTYDAETLFHLALEADRKQEDTPATRLYLRLVKEFPNSRFSTPAHFNLGLLFENHAHFDKAFHHFASIASLETPADEKNKRTWVDAHYRAAVCAGELEHWWTAVAMFDAVLAMPWLDANDKLEALVGRGLSLRNAGDLIGAETTLSQALRLVSTQLSVGHFDDRGLAAEAAFHMGEIMLERFQGIVLEFPEETLTKRLEQKCQFLLAAQSRYVRAIRYGDAHTVAAAGLRIGSLYESLYKMVVDLQAPPDLTEEQVEIYTEEVKKRVWVLVKKALTAYERSLDIGKRAPTASKWVARLEQAVERLKKIYLEYDEL